MPKEIKQDNLANSKIICPKCGREYLPCEIFVPTYLVGKIYPERDYTGAIIDEEVKVKPDFNETYECDCGAMLSVTADIKYNVSVKNEYSSDIIIERRETKISLLED